MFAMKIALLHARKTPKMPISKMLICKQRRNRQFFKRWFATNGKKFFSKRWFIKRRKRQFFKCWFAINSKMPETLDATQWLCQICIEKPRLCKFRKTIPRAKKCLPLKLRYYTHEKRQKRQFLKRWFATNGKKFLSKRWFIKKSKTSVLQIFARQKGL